MLTYPDVATDIGLKLLYKSLILSRGLSTRVSKGVWLLGLSKRLRGSFFSCFFLGRCKIPFLRFQTWVHLRGLATGGSEASTNYTWGDTHRQRGPTCVLNGCKAFGVVVSFQVFNLETHNDLNGGAYVLKYYEAILFKQLVLLFWQWFLIHFRQLSLWVVNNVLPLQHYESWWQGTGQRLPLSGYISHSLESPYLGFD